MTSRTVLALNSGSSSLKAGLFRAGTADVELLQSFSTETDDPELALAKILQQLDDASMPTPDVIGHRLVHGGPSLLTHCLIDAAVLQQLQVARPFAPLHLPAALSLISLSQQHFPGLPQVACFDTAFHRDLPDFACYLPIPLRLHADGIRRYGFHGLSCESILQQLGEARPSRLVIAHLGNGVSVSAVRDGTSIDTSMGLTPSGGVMMGSRSGDIDPGVLIHLMRKDALDAEALEDLVDRQSGLLGVSGLSSDMRQLQAASDSNPLAKLAVRMFSYQLRKQIAAMIAALDGIDLLVFTGGIGEHHASVRSAICSGLSWIGLQLDGARNEVGIGSIQASVSSCQVRVLRCQETDQIARHSFALVRASH